jgi:hypothetical protein
MTVVRSLLALALVVLVAGSAQADGKKLLLRYKFTPGETVRWQVTNRVEFKTSVSGHTQRTSTLSTSVKAWAAKEVDAAANATTLVNTVDHVNMRQQFSGRAEVEYDSSKDTQPPAGFEAVAASVGVPLSEFKLDNRGEMLTRSVLNRSPGFNDSENRAITMPLPAEPVGVGDHWELPYPIRIPTESGAVVTVQARDYYKVESITGTLVKIASETQILSPVDRPDVRVKLVQQTGRGHVWFDAALGRVMRIELVVDDEVIGFQGPASSLQYKSRFEERLVE